MATKNRSQIRLQQITGSLTNIRSALPAQTSAGTAAASLTEANIPDLESILEYYAKAIQNIHGNQEFGANTPGQFEYGSGLGIKALKPSVTDRQVLGAATLSSESSVSGLTTSNLSDTTLLIESTTIGLSGAPSYSLSGNAIKFSNSGGDTIVFRVVSSSSSSITVVGLPEASSVASMSVSGVSTIEQGTIVGVEWKNVRAKRIEGISGLAVQGGSGALDLDAASLDADFTGAFDLQAGASSEIGLSDGVLQLDLNGTDVVDGLLVDAEGSITLEAAHGSDGAMILNANGSGGVIQLQQQGAAKLLVSGSEVRVTDQFRVIDGTDSSSTTTGAVQVTGGIGIGGKAFIGGDIDGAGDVTFDKTNVSVSIGAGAHQLAEDSSGLKLAAVGSSKKLALSAAGDDVTISAAGTASQVVLSGAMGIEFRTSENDFSYTGFSGVTGLLLEKDASEAGTFQSNFSTSTSLLGAINSLASSITASEPTLFTASIGAAGVAEASSGGVLLVKQEGDVASFDASIKRNALDVYVNGQLMHSGSETDRGLGTADYNVHPSSANRIRFAFDLVADDVVTAIDRS